MRILYVSHARQFSGAEIALLNLLRGNRHWTSFIYAPPGEYYDELVQQGMNVISARALGSMNRDRSVLWPFRFIINMLVTAKDLFQVIKRIDPDCIHSNHLSSTPYCVIPALFSGKKLIWHMHDIRRFASLDGIAVFLSSLFSRFVIAISDAVRRSLTACHVAADKIMICFNGIDVSSVVNNDASPVPLVKRVQGRINIVQIGLLEPRKGCHLLLQAVDIMKRKGLTREQAHFYLVGDTIKHHAYVATLLSYIEQHQLQEHVTLCGRTRNMRSIYESSDVLVHTPMEPEPFGLVVIEAMAMGCLVIAADSGALPEIVADGKTGLLFRNNDVQHLTEKMHQAIDRYDSFDRIRENARNQVLDVFSLENQRKRLLQIYTSL